MATLLKANKDFATETRIPVESPIEGYTAYIIEARSPRNPLWRDYTPALVIDGRTIRGKAHAGQGAAQAEIDDFFASLIEEQQQIQVEVDEAAIDALVAEVAQANPTTCDCGSPISGDGCNNSECLNFPPTIRPALLPLAYKPAIYPTADGWTFEGAGRCYTTPTDADVARTEMLAELA